MTPCWKRTLLPSGDHLAPQEFLAVAQARDRRGIAAVRVHEEDLDVPPDARVEHDPLAIRRPADL